eukprot:6968369-Pyramimonas_sp.AAC.1
MFPCSDGSELVICMKCKFYSSHGALRGLAARCDPPPSKFGVWVWQQICKSRHPKRKGVVVQLGVNLRDGSNLFRDGLPEAVSEPVPPPPLPPAAPCPLHSQGESAGISEEDEKAR